MTGRRLVVVPCGEPRDASVTLAADAVAETYDVEVTVGSPLPLPEAAHDATRDQYRAEAFLGEAPGDDAGRLLVTDVDLFYRRTNYVFGLSTLGGHSAVFSTYRLRTTDDELTVARVRKQAVKQVGRLLGLERCAGDCVLAHASTVADLDDLPATLCAECRLALSSGAHDDAPTDGATTDTTSSGSRRPARAVAPTKADVEAIERSADSDADRKDVGEQVVDEAVTTVRFTAWLGALAGSFLVVGASLFWLVEDLVGIQLDTVGEYVLLVVTLLLALAVARKVMRVGGVLWTVARS